jgi:hypothetical protein
MPKTNAAKTAASTPTPTPAARGKTAKRTTAKKPGRASKTPAAKTTTSSRGGTSTPRRTRPAASSGRRLPAARTPLVPDRLFDVTTVPAGPISEDVERVELAQITLAPNPRKDISDEGIDRLAGGMMRSGQLVPAIGRRVSDSKVIIYAGQRRFLSAGRSHELAGTPGYEGLRPVLVLRVKLLDHEPTKAEIRRIQAQENQHEGLSMRDRQEQFIDCWLEYTGLSEDERILAVCDDLGYSATLAHNLRRQMTLPEDIRARVAERPSGSELSITLANQLAEMHQIAPELTTAVAARITTSDHHHQALQSIGAFVHRTIVENDEIYAVRIDEGEAVLNAYEEIERGRAHLTPQGRSILASELDVDEKKLDEQLKKLAGRARATSFKVDIDRGLRERAVAGSYAWVYRRGEDYADAIWVIAPEFMLAAINEALATAPAASGRDDHYFSAADVSDEDTNAAKEQLAKERQERRERQQDGESSNLGLGHDIGRGVLEPSDEQLDALRRVVALLVCECYPQIVAYGAGWSDRARQQPVGDSGKRFEPRTVDAIVQAELERALADPDPTRGMMQIIARFAAAFVLDRNGVTATTTLGSTRMQNRLARALPDGPSELRAAIWQLIRPFLSPRLAEVNHDAFVLDETLEPAADLDAHRAASALADVDLGEEAIAA